MPSSDAGLSTLRFIEFPNIPGETVLYHIKAPPREISEAACAPASNLALNYSALHTLT